jgi:hypothetical protein
MTASPLCRSSKSGNLESVSDRLQSLQENLDAIIITVSDRNKLLGHVPRAEEYIIEYPFVSTPPVAIVGDIIWDRFISLRDRYQEELNSNEKGRVDKAKKLMDMVDLILMELGVLCAYQFLSKSQSQHQQNSELDITTHLKSHHLSPKVLVLIDILTERYDASLSSSSLSIQDVPRTIVFVETRKIASTLCELFNLLSPHQFPSLKASYMTGHGNGTGEKMNEKYQRIILDKFKTGEVNVLVATNVAEEGLDVYVYFWFINDNEN